MANGKRYFLGALGLALGVAAGTPALAAGSTEKRAVPPFHALEVSGAIDVVVRRDAAKGLVLSGEPAELRRIVSEVKNGVLSLRQEPTPGSRWNPWNWFQPAHAPVSCTVSAANLDSVTISGASQVDASGLAGPEFAFKVSGASSAQLRGTTRHLVLTMSGAGKVDAAKLVAERAELALSGVSDVIVNARETLEVSASGAGKVSYVGHPKIDQHISGMAVIRPL